MKHRPMHSWESNLWEKSFDLLGTGKACEHMECMQLKQIGLVMSYTKTEWSQPANSITLNSS